MNPDQHTTMIPLMLDLSDFRVLVIGNGAVGSRKAHYFEGAEVITLNEVPENLAAALAEFDIIIAATGNPALNERICQEASAQKKWYNSATAMGNFLIPAAFKDGGCTIAVSTNGKAPAVSAFIRDKVCEAYPSLPAMIELQETMRAELKTAVAEQPKRAEILRAILDDREVWAALDAGDTAGALTLSRRYV